MVEKVSTEEILYQIITDRRYISATDGNGETVDLMVRSLAPTEKSQAQFIYNKAMRQARKNKLPTEKQCMADAINMGYWTKEQERLITLRTAEIDRIEKERVKYKKNKGKTIKYRTDSIIATKALNALLEEQAGLCAHSAENHAKTIRANYIISRITMDIDDTQYWTTYRDFLSNDDTVILSSLIDGYNRIKPITEKEIRSVARNGGWSLMWNVSKKSGDTLFDKPTSAYSPEQSLLCYWALMYDSVYESMDKPSDKVIEDDEALDKWFDEQKKKSAATSKAAQTGDVFKGHKGGGASQQEEFVMVTSEHEADDVYDMNDKWSLSQIRSETQKIENSGRGMQEYELRRNKIKRQLQLQNSSKFADARRGNARGGGFLG